MGGHKNRVAELKMVYGMFLKRVEFERILKENLSFHAKLRN